MVDLLIDRLLPQADFRTRYTRVVAAEPARVWAALHEVTFAELPVTRLLVAVRSGGRARLVGPVTRTVPMPVLDQVPGRELVVGRVAKFWQPAPVSGPASASAKGGFSAFTEPGWAKAAMSFQLTPQAGGRTLLAAETRVLTTDAAAWLRFAPYWLVIRAGGAGFIRQEMLRAVARRAEGRASVE
jgi:uncharacterized protein YndB with AHSA1/START domain